MNATLKKLKRSQKSLSSRSDFGFPDGYNHDATNFQEAAENCHCKIIFEKSSDYFLDEPTASLDAIATEQIKNSLDAIKAGRTVIIISHSLSQILDSDTIYVMKKGRVVENGTHDELYNKEGTYREIFDASARSLNLDKLVNTYKEN
jgi:ABC-type multidrug transport system ATPase subunit